MAAPRCPLVPDRPADADGAARAPSDAPCAERGERGGARAAHYELLSATADDAAVRAYADAQPGRMWGVHWMAAGAYPGGMFHPLGYAGGAYGTTLWRGPHSEGLSLSPVWDGGAAAAAAAAASAEGLAAAAAARLPTSATMLRLMRDARRAARARGDIPPA